MKDTTPKIEKIQRELMMKMTPNQRITLACEMFTNSRELFLASLPNDLSEEEVKKRLYFQTYGEHLPDDFFDKR